MSDLETRHLRLPYIAAAQAQKHVTHNEALRALDAIVQLAVLDADQTVPPGSPVDGDRHIVADGATGAWTGKDAQVAAWVDGAWQYAAPSDGWLAYEVASEALLVHRAGAWEPVATGGGIGDPDMLGINATADTTNRLAVRSEAVLFTGIADADGGTGDVRVIVDKETEADTASVIFQDGASGRAEIGLAGDDDLVVKVSADGSTWTEAIRVDKDTGAVTLPYDNALSGLVADTVQDAIDEIAAAGGGGGGAVASVFGRAGAVAAASGDYDASQVDNDSGVSGATVKDALDALASGKQTADADLTAIAALSPSNDDIIQRKAGAWTNRTPAQVKSDLALAKGDVGLGNVTNDAQLKAASNLSDLANAGTARTNLGVAIGSNVQAYSAQLAAVAGLSPSNDDIIQRKAGAWANRTPAQVKSDLALAKGDVGLGNVTNDAQLKAASNLSDLANAGTARTNLGLGDAAVKNTGTGTGTLAAGDDTRITGSVQKASNLSDVASAATAFANIKQAASDTVSGVVELATDAEVQARSDTARAVTPAGVASVTRERLTAARTYYVRTAPVNVTSILNASPAVVAATAHGLSADDPVVFGTSGALPTGLTVGTVYYVRATGLTANQFQVSATPGGSAINTSSAGSGTHTFQTGNDANAGLAATRAGALLTIQAAYDHVAADLDLSGKTVIIQLANSTYAAGLSVAAPWTGGGAVTVEGANTTGAIVPGIIVAAALPGAFTIQKMKLVKAGGVGLLFSGSGNLIIGANVDFGGCDYHIFQNGPGSYIQATNGYTISAGAYQHGYIAGPCFFQVEGGAVTLSGTPAFGGEFLYANNCCFVRITATFSGSGTGKRYTVVKNASVEVNGAGASYLPGNSAGSVATGGQYN